MKHTKRGPVVAIDGPAGTGKSSVTKRLCQALKYVHVDTGALYRVVALSCLEKRVFLRQITEDPKSRVFSPEIEKIISDLSRELHIEFKQDLSRNPSNRVILNGEDVSDRIRTAEVSMASSAVSAVSGVRASLLGLQRKLGCAGHAILEGRDIGTVIFPDADVKFFMTASVEERAKRRLSELEASGADTPSYESLLRQIAERDRSDSTRQLAPLKKADDAIEIETTKLSLDEVVAKMEKIIREKVGSA